MTEYELTRRDALAALAAAGVVGAASAALEGDGSDETGQAAELGGHEMRTLQAVAGVVYPDAVEGVDDFVTTYVNSRTRADPERAAGIAEAVGELDSYARAWYDTDYLGLGAEQRDDALREMGVGVVEPDPDGGDADRVRFYLVNELLYALYATPTGGELVGLENPQGHPGGLRSYRQGP